MADVKISALPAAGSALGPDEIPVNEAGTTKKVTANQLKTFIGAVTTVSGTAPVVSSGGLTPAISMHVADSTHDGYLNQTDWATFNNKFTLPSLTAGSVLFSDGSTIAQDNANLFWDNTNNRLGIGTNAPTANLHLPGVTIAVETASLKIDSGTVMTTPENGAIESDGIDLWWTNDTGTRISLSTVGGGGANTTLSNLASVAFNVDLLPGTNNTLNIGDATHKILNMDISTISNTGQPVINVNSGTILDLSSSLQSIDFNTRLLTYNDGSTTSLDWQNGFFQDPTGTTSLIYGSARQLVDTTSQTAIDWDTRQGKDSAGTLSLDWNNYILQRNGATRLDWGNFFLGNANGNPTIDWSAGGDNVAPVPGTIDFINNKISNVIDPTADQDAATKIYVDGPASKVSARVNLASNSAVTANNPIIFDTVVYDTSSSYSTGTGLFTAPKDGFVIINISTATLLAGGSLYATKNGTNVGYLCANGVASTTFGGGIHIDVTAGDTVGIYTDTTGTFLGNANGLNNFSISYI